jgi:hypothetical protein
MLGTLLSMAGFDLKRQVRSVAMTAIFASAGVILIVLALAFGIAALYEWLKLYYGTLPALGILGGTWAVLAIVFFCFAFLRPKGRRRRVAAVNPLREPAAAIVQATEQAVDDATNLVRQGSRKQVFGALIVAVLTGFLIGRRF